MSKKRLIAVVELIIIIIFSYHLTKDIDKVPVVRDYIYMLIIESLGLDIYFKFKSKL